MYNLFKKYKKVFEMAKIFSLFTILFIIIICFSAYTDGRTSYAVYYGGIGFSIMLVVGILIRFSKQKKA